MQLTDLLTRSCTIVHRAAGESRNAYGDRLQEETRTTTVCELQQRQASEDDDRGQVGRSGWLLILLPGTRLQLGDEVIVDGENFEVIGEPWFARDPLAGETSHVEAAVQRTAAPGDPQGS